MASGGAGLGGGPQGGTVPSGGAGLGGNTQGGVTATGGVNQAGNSRGGSLATGGAGLGGGAQGGTAAIGGTVATGGKAQGGTVATGGTVGATGGTVAATGGTVAATGGTVAATGGTVAATGGTVAATGGTVAATGGTVAATGGSTSCKYTPASGSVVTPPSNGFEANTTGWALVSGSTSAISRATGSANACEGSAYLVCDGSKRTNAWDGPAINVLSYLKSGRTYTVTLAARFDPAKAPSAAAPLQLSVAVACTSTSVGSAYSHLQATDTLTSWVRFTGTLPTTMTGCSSISVVQVYVETVNTSEQADSIDVDDFQLIDTT